MTLVEFRKQLKQALSNIYGEAYEYDVCFVVKYCLGKSNCWALDDIVENAVATHIIRKINQHVPIQYICGIEEFLGEPFIVFDGVFIPREETEDLVSIALSVVSYEATVLEVGIGTGVIGISLLKHRNDIKRLIGIDINPLAIVNTHVNARNKQVINRLELVQCDVLTCDLNNMNFDFVISNPPYLPDIDRLSVHNSVKYEPETALYGGVNGIEFIMRLIDKLSTLDSIPPFLFEYDHTTSGLLKKFLLERDLKVKYYSDRFGRERFALIWHW